MHDLARASDLTEAQLSVTHMSNKVKELLADLRKWKVDFDITVIPETLDLRITMRKGDDGYTKTFPVDTVLYYKDDAQSIIAQVIDLVYVRLLKEQIENEITEKISKAVTNINKIHSMR